MTTTTKTTAAKRTAKGTPMNRTRSTQVAAALLLAVTAGLSAGCGPAFDPPSLIERTRVLGARIEVEGDPGRATPAPGESATVTWLMAAPGPTPPVTWMFALCLPAGNAGCAGDPLATYEGATSPPTITLAVPGADTLGMATSLILLGQICDGGAPIVDPGSGLPGCSDGGQGTTVSVSIRLQVGAVEANRNPIADRGLTFDGQPWAPLPTGGDPCAAGPRVTAGTEEHAIGLLTAGADRETFTTLAGDPPVPTVVREALQISSFGTGGELTSPYAFVEADEPGDAPVAEAQWSAPPANEITGDTPVTFVFVVRDGRGGVDWVVRAACVGL